MSAQRDSDRSIANGALDAAAHRIELPTVAMTVMRNDARRGYPEEVCGILVGREAGGSRIIERAVPVENSHRDERTRRYIIDADTLRRAEREAHKDGMDVLGFYHSHPDHPAIPSTFDREHSWPWYTYIILAVSSNALEDVRAWQLADDRADFRELPIAPSVPVPVPETRTQPQNPAPETRPKE